MEILGVGPMELVLILIIALIILGPNDMVKTGRTIGRALRRIVKSPAWAAIQETSRGLRTLPNRLMREAGLEEDIQDLKQTQEELRREVEAVRKVRTPIAESFKELDNEVHTIGKDLSAWTAQPGDAAAQFESGAPAPGALSAWTTPPAHVRPPEDGTPPPAEPPAPES